MADPLIPNSPYARYNATSQYTGGPLNMNGLPQLQNRPFMPGGNTYNGWNATTAMGVDNGLASPIGYNNGYGNGYGYGYGNTLSADGSSNPPPPPTSPVPETNATIPVHDTTITVNDTPAAVTKKQDFNNLADYVKKSFKANMKNAVGGNGDWLATWNPFLGFDQMNASRPKQKAPAATNPLQTATTPTTGGELPPVDPKTKIKSPIGGVGGVNKPGKIINKGGLSSIANVGGSKEWHAPNARQRTSGKLGGMGGFGGFGF